MNNHTHICSRLLVNLEQTTLSFSIYFAKFKNIKNAFSLFHHFHCIIAAITFAHSGASLLALAIL